MTTQEKAAQVTIAQEIFIRRIAKKHFEGDSALESDLKNEYDLAFRAAKVWFESDLPEHLE